MTPNWQSLKKNSMQLTGPNFYIMTLKVKTLTNSVKKIKEIMDAVASVKQVRILSKHCYVEPWMTKGLEIAAWKKCELYKTMLR